MNSTRKFLLFRLQGPMAAFGEITVGERRSLWGTPSKSGVLGLISACLGIHREEHTKLLELDNSLGFAVRVDRSGDILRDYHTAMAPEEASRKKRQKEGKPLGTRKDDLSCDSLSTVLSERFYRLNSACTVALWIKPGHACDFERMKAALTRPVFTPYLGRKSCPLGAPTLPKIIEGEGLLATFDAYDKLSCNESTHNQQAEEIWFECKSGLDAEESAAAMIRERRDSLRNRRMWQFSPRMEGKLIWKATEKRA